jgi:8-hydroxy-5-deazaflavin:NADPH oxidoreductase
MTSVTIFGKGAMGSAIAGVLSQGATVTHLTSAATEAAIDGDIVVLAVPTAKVLKAFNTNFAATLVAGQVGGAEPTTVLVAGDDAQAKQTLIDLVTAGGLQAADAGSLKRARELEAVGFLQLTLAVSEKIGWTGGYAVVR